MTFVARPTLRKAFIGVAIVATSLVGLQLQASEVRPVARSVPGDEMCRSAPRAEGHERDVALAGETVAGFDRPADQRMAASFAAGRTSDEAVALVPAIYAWDPDVRFVYFRHVSKWM